MKIIVVVPAYNEAVKIGEVVKDIKKEIENVIVVDDGSNDETGEIAKTAGAIVLTHSINRGQGAALQTGINFALEYGADIIVTFDADGQLLASEIDQVVKPLLLGEVDIVLGSRFLNKSSTFLRGLMPQGKVLDKINQIPANKKIILRLAILVTRLYTGLKITDTHNGFRAISSQAAKKIEIRQDGMAHASEILEQIKKYNLKFKEVPVTMRYTEYSIKKGQKLSNSFRIILDLILDRFSK